MLQQRPAGLFSDTRHAEGAGGGVEGQILPQILPHPQPSEPLVVERRRKRHSETFNKVHLLST